MWKTICKTLKALGIDFAELVLYTTTMKSVDEFPRKNIDVNQHHWQQNASSVIYIWMQNEGTSYSWLNNRGMLKVEKSLFVRDNQTKQYYGSLIVIKDIENQPSNHFIC